MKAHLYLEGGGMVTGTHDVTEARRLLVDAWLEYNVGGPYDREDIAHASRRFAARSASIETGRIVPAGPDHWEGYSWFWRKGYELGKRGVTRAVVWNG